MERWLAFVGLSVTLTACAAAQPVPVQMPPASPNVVVANRVQARVGLGTLVTPDRVCSQNFAARDFCVERFGQSVQQGLADLVGRFMQPVSAPPAEYTAHFRVVDLSFAPADTMGHAVWVAMRWQFELRSATGEPVVQVAERTEGPNAIVTPAAAGTSFLAMWNAVLERIGTALNASAVVQPEPVADEPFIAPPVQPPVQPL